MVIKLKALNLKQTTFVLKSNHCLFSLFKKRVSCENWQTKEVLLQTASWA